MYTYTLIKGEYVLAKLGQGIDVICVDFNGMRLMNCGDLTVNVIQNFIEGGVAVFYTKEAVASE